MWEKYKAKIKSLFSIFAGILIWYFLFYNPNPWKSFSIKKSPDYSCLTGPQGYQFYIWDCFNNEHIIVYQYQGQLGKMTPIIEKSKCGERTEFEIKNEIVSGKTNECIGSGPDWIIN